MTRKLTVYTEETDPETLDSEVSRETEVTCDSMVECVRMLSHGGASEPSCSVWIKGVWYTSESEQNYRTGQYVRRSFHLSGFSSAEEWDIYQSVIAR